MAEFLGVDTSNYTTSLAVSDEKEVTLNLKKLLPVAEGERGLRQSDALFHHTVQLPELAEKLGAHSLAAVGMSVRPRNAEGSYMPCFLAGKSFGTGISSLLGIPAYHFSHQEGHIAAALYSCGREDLHGQEFLALHLSGGTTELLHCKGNEIEIIGRTLDISAGQSIDRAGVKMGLRFPCGRELEELLGDRPLTNKVKISVKGCDCNLSGLENKASEMIEKSTDKGEIAAYIFSFVAETVSAMVSSALESYPSLPVVFSGGVMSNRAIKSLLSERFGGLFAEPQYSSDNAAGISRLTYLKYSKLI
ncbi:MAG: peptidase M22 [Firmicutes bacterium]|nr:peptidase M22 [Candidatus Colimorpha enterica]